MSASKKKQSSAGPGGNRRAVVRQAQLEAAATAKRRRTLTQIGIVGAVALVAIGIVAAALLLGRGSPAAGPPQVASTVTVAGRQVPFAVEGSAFRLGPADAPAKVDLWVDYSCPHCADFEAANNDVLNQLVAGGNVAVNYHNIQIVTGYGTQAGSAAACVAVNDTGRWPEVNAALYANHSAETDGWSAAQFADWAGQQGVNSQAQDCIRNRTYTGWITANTQASVEADVKGTPTMFLNGQPSELLSGAALTEAVRRLASS